MKRTLTTSEAALLYSFPPGSFARWARARGVEPLRRMRIGRSTMTVWSIAALADATRPVSTVLDAERAAC